MSASLVGSEMCIRDRPLVARGKLAWRCGREAAVQYFKVDLESSARPRSVSYTHLTLPTICSV
eukprot:7788080-Alexandrium_andersonii.AAC.1